MAHNAFVFLYPQEEIFDDEIEKGSALFDVPDKQVFEGRFLPRILTASSKEEKEQIQSEARAEKARLFRPRYSFALNLCIHRRYRSRGFSINYTVLDDCSVSDVIKQWPGDRVVKVGIDSVTHRSRQSDGSFIYPDNACMLSQIGPVDRIVVAGFHVNSCVEKFAEHAYTRGIPTLVDEDLTDYFPSMVKRSGFSFDHYPSYNARLHEGRFFDLFMRARKGRPWLWQEY